MSDYSDLIISAASHDNSPDAFDPDAFTNTDEDIDAEGKRQQQRH